MQIPVVQELKKILSLDSKPLTPNGEKYIIKKVIQLLKIKTSLQRIVKEFCKDEDLHSYFVKKQKRLAKLQMKNC